MQNCAHLVLFPSNSAPGWCTFVLICCFFGAFWCSVMVPSLCIWFNISFLGKNGAPGWCKFALIWCFFFQLGAPGWCKCVLIWHFFLQDVAPGWCTILCSSGVFSSKLCSWLLHSSGVFSSKWFSWLVRNLCPSDSFFLQNGAPS